MSGQLEFLSQIIPHLEGRVGRNKGFLYDLGETWARLKVFPGLGILSGQKDQERRIFDFCTVRIPGYSKKGSKLGDLLIDQGSDLHYWIKKIGEKELRRVMVPKRVFVQGELEGVTFREKGQNRKEIDNHWETVTRMIGGKTIHG